jgi:hypothetical protein
VGLAFSLMFCILLDVNDTETPKDRFENTGGRAIPGVYSVTPLRGLLSLMHSVENQICLNKKACDFQIARRVEGEGTC